jgi:hypothetical protein
LALSVAGHRADGLLSAEALQDCPPGALAEVTEETVLPSALTCQRAGHGLVRWAIQAVATMTIVTDRDRTERISL